MTLEQYIKEVDLLEKSEIDKVMYLTYYYGAIEELSEITPDNVKEWFDTLNLGQPNITRLLSKIVKSRDFIKGPKKNTFRLHAKTVLRLREALPFLSAGSEEIIFTSCILPEDLFSGTRGYIEKFSKQINASYDHKLYDACAVLMRRLLEILLIHAYQHLKIESRILGASGEFKDLKAIIADAQGNPTLGLSKSAKGCIDEFRVLGNFSAHKLMYNCRKDDIKNIALDYRATLEELFYKAGLRK